MNKTHQKNVPKMLKLCFSWDSLVYTDVSMYVFENACLHARASLDMAASQDAHVVRLKIEKTVCQIAPTNTREKNRPCHISHAHMFSNRCLIFLGLCKCQLPAFSTALLFAPETWSSSGYAPSRAHDSSS